MNTYFINQSKSFAFAMQNEQSIKDTLKILLAVFS